MCFSPPSNIIYPANLIRDVYLSPALHHVIIHGPPGCSYSHMSVSAGAFAALPHHTGSPRRHHAMTDELKSSIIGAVYLVSTTQHSSLALSCDSTDSYTLDSHAYAALATQAAYATSLLTSTITSTPQQTKIAHPAAPTTAAANGNQESRSISAPLAQWRPLDPEQQEIIAKQLCAWAGLQGPKKQAEARQALEQRKLHLVREASKERAAELVAANDDPATATDESFAQPHASPEVFGAADPRQVTEASAFFPPDFASHYRAQLQNLAQGYYQQLHLDGLTKDFHADVESDESAMQRHVDIDVFQVPDASRNGSFSQVQAVDAVTLSSADQKRQPRLRNEFEAAVAVRTRSLGVPADSVAALLSNAIPPKSPEAVEGGQDPIQLLTAASTVSGANPNSETVLEKLLRFAHVLYQTGNETAKQADASVIVQLHPTLLPLLHALHKLHPTHLPTLLLLSCAYYSAGDLPASLYWNDRILTIDPRYVEAMR